MRNDFKMWLEIVMGRDHFGNPEICMKAIEKKILENVGL
jgi:hypothetical protein